MASADAAAAARAALAEPSPPAARPEPPAATTAPKLDHERWLELVARSELKGPARELAAHAVFLGHEGDVLRLGLSPDDELLNSEPSCRALSRALAPALGAGLQLRFEATAHAGGETLRQRSERQRGARQEAAESAFMADPGVQQLIQRHGATLVPDSIRPHDE